MPIAGVIVVTAPDKTQEILEQMNAFENVTTYGVYKGNHIVAVFEADSSKGLEKLSDNLTDRIPGILGIYPSYVNFEDEVG
ncbi:MAG TPA: hypothetical protein ENK14_02805 [Caldithrix sp.]|nr:hypothetical protein [Caldithrix sp.]